MSNPSDKTMLVITGPPAVGKMTVGNELEKLTGLKLFHNHMTIDLAIRFFDFGTAAFGRLVSEFRRRIIEEVAQSDLPGLIFTYCWAFNLDKEKDDQEKNHVHCLTKPFLDLGANVWFAELEADL